jgi:hypothetical protein
MVLALLQTQGPAGVEPTEEESEPAETPRAAAPWTEAPLAEPVGAEVSPEALAIPETLSEPTMEDGPVPSGEMTTRTTSALAPVGPAGHPAVDAAALSAALAAVVPALPSEHRGSLATVFRALAEALEAAAKAEAAPAAGPGVGVRPAPVAPAVRPRAPLDQ